MKRLKLFMAFALPISLATILIHCSEESLDHQEAIVDLSIPKDMGGLKWSGLTLPSGTTSELSLDGSTLKVKLPKGIIYVAEYNDQFAIAIDGGYTCTSTCSGGCDVIKLGEDIGCKACPEGSRQPCTGQETYAQRFSIGKGKGGGFVNLNQGISFVEKGHKRPSQVLQSPNWEVLMMHPEVSKTFNEFYSSVTARKQEGESMVRLLTNVFGTYVLLNVPEGYQNTRLGANVITSAAVSCGCSSGQDGCEQEDVTAGPFRTKVGDKCVAGDCVSCTMSW